MKPEELSGYIGEIDDELIAGAKKKRRINNKIFVIAVSMAACAVIAVTVVFLTSGNNIAIETSVPVTGGYTEKGTEISSGIMTEGADPELPHTEESYETDIEIITSYIFYVNDSKTEKTPMEHEASPKAVFELWKKLNSIGDEVKISVKTYDNGRTEESEIDGQSVTTYHVGDHYSYELTISGSIENYYSKTDKDLLLNSLEKTMLDAAEIKPDEFIIKVGEG